MPKRPKLNGPIGDAIAAQMRRELESGQTDRPRRRYPANRRPSYRNGPVEAGTVERTEPTPGKSLPDATTLGWVGHNDLSYVASSDVLQSALERWRGTDGLRFPFPLGPTDGPRDGDDRSKRGGTE